MDNGWISRRMNGDMNKLNKDIKIAIVKCRPKIFILEFASDRNIMTPALSSQFSHLVKIMIGYLR